MSGQKVVDLDVSESGVSELLRLFIKSRCGHDEEVDADRSCLLSIVIA